MRFRKLGPIVVFITFCVFMGCNDRYSQRRIDRRWQAVNGTITDSAEREADGTRRLREAGETADHWLKKDAERFNERMPTIGDYAW
jgi:hypothetical protein